MNFSAVAEGCVELRGHPVSFLPQNGTRPRYTTRHNRHAICLPMTDTDRRQHNHPVNTGEEPRKGISIDKSAAIAAPTEENVRSEWHLEIERADFSSCSYRTLSTCRRAVVCEVTMAVIVSEACALRTCMQAPNHESNALVVATLTDVPLHLPPNLAPTTISTHVPTRLKLSVVVFVPIMCAVPDAAPRFSCLRPVRCFENEIPHQAVSLGVEMIVVLLRPLAIQTPYQPHVGREG